MSLAVLQRPDGDQLTCRSGLIENWQLKDPTWSESLQLTFTKALCPQ